MSVGIVEYLALNNKNITKIVSCREFPGFQNTFKNIKKRTENLTNKCSLF